MSTLASSTNNSINDVESSYLIDHEKIQTGLVDWTIAATWQHSKPPSAVLNEVFRVCDGNDEVSTQVYNYINELGRFDQESLCKHVLYNDIYDKIFPGAPPNVISTTRKIGYYFTTLMDQTTDLTWDAVCKINHYSHEEDIQGLASYAKSYSFPNMDRSNLDSLLRHCSPNGLVGRLVYAREYLSEDLFHVILILLRENLIIDVPKRWINKLRGSLDTVIVDDALKIVCSCCTFGDFVRLSCVNRNWFHLLQDFLLVKRLIVCKKFTLTDYNAKQWVNLRSSQWLLTDLKMLTITATKHSLRNSKFPPVDITNVQYLHSSICYFSTLPENLKALKISGVDACVRAADYAHFMLFHDPSSPIKLTVVAWDFRCRIEEIPSSKAILFETSRVRNSTIVNCVKDENTTWVGLQNCLSTIPSRHQEPNPNETFDNYYPDTTLALIYSSDWSDYWLLLSSESFYDKYILNLFILTEWQEVNMDTIILLKRLIKIKNLNTSKYLSILFSFDAKITDANEDEYLARDTWIFGFLKDYFWQILANASIKSFKLGIINTHNRIKRGHIFDVKKLEKYSQVTKIDQIWHRILYTDKTQDSPQEWEAEFQKMIDLMPLH